jgi:hypothetical protein
MYAIETEVTSWMESRGYNTQKSLDKISYFKDNGKIRSHVSFNQAASEFCYSRGEYRHGTEGQVLNEKGKIAKEKDIILRADNGYVLVRMNDSLASGPKDINGNEADIPVKRESVTKGKKE